MRVKVDLSRYVSPDTPSGLMAVRSILWFLLGSPLCEMRIVPWSIFRVKLLRLFGATIGEGVVIKPRVIVKRPWLLTVGSHSWIGERVWIDNIESVKIGSNVCVSQDVYLCTGNHRWDSACFDLCALPIVLEDGSWVGARSTIGPGVTIRTQAVISIGSVISRSVGPDEIVTTQSQLTVRQRVVRPSL